MGGQGLISVCVGPTSATVGLECTIYARRMQCIIINCGGGGGGGGREAELALAQQRCDDYWVIQCTHASTCYPG